MSYCNNYTSPCCPEVPYPSISSESVPSLIDNLVYALYGTINKTIVNGRVVWDIPCDPNNTSEVDNVPREEGEGLLCYLIRVFNETFVAGSPFARWGFAGSGTNTFTLNGATLANQYGYLVYINGIVQDPINFTVSGFPNPTLTLSAPVPVGSYITIIQLQINGATGATGPQGTPGGATGATGPIGATGAMPIGGGVDKLFYENDIVMTTNYTIASGKNAMSAGPITVNSGVTLTIPSGSVYKIV